MNQPTSEQWANLAKRQNEPLNSQSDFVWFVNLSDSISSKSPIRRKIASKIFREISKEFRRAFYLRGLTSWIKGFDKVRSIES